MAVSDTLDRLASTAPVPVHVVRGVGWGPGVARLHADPDVQVVSTPRHAVVLVVAGAVPRSLLHAVAAVHDQVPSPRGAAAIDLDMQGAPPALPLGEVTLLPSDDPVPALRSLARDVVAGRRDNPPRGPHDNPVEWQGVGPHGQGGEGMMGGTPYGRMMPMPPTQGRDGLALDRLSLTLGPFLPGLPPGLVVDVGLQGDVLEDVTLRTVDVDDPLVGVPVSDPRSTAVREAARHLQAVADVAALAGLDALGRRAARVAVDPSPRAVAALRRRLDRPWGLRAATDGVGVLDLDGRDVTARWQGWLDAAVDALQEPPATVAPDATGPSLDLADLGHQLVGMEVGQAWLTLCSLQLRLLARTVPTAPLGTA